MKLMFILSTKRVCLMYCIALIFSWNKFQHVHFCNTAVTLIVSDHNVRAWFITRRISKSTNRQTLLSGKYANLVYIDGTDAASEGTFVSSVTGATLSYTKWAAHEPNNCCGGENCLNMYSHEDGLWNDLNCDVPLPAACEIKRGACICVYVACFA